MGNVCLDIIQIHDPQCVSVFAGVGGRQMSDSMIYCQGRANRFEWDGAKGGRRRIFLKYSPLRLIAKVMQTRILADNTTISAIY